MKLCGTSLGAAWLRCVGLRCVKLCCLRLWRALRLWRCLATLARLATVACLATVAAFRGDALQSSVALTLSGDSGVAACCVAPPWGFVALRGSCVRLCCVSWALLCQPPWRRLENNAGIRGNVAKLAPCKLSFLPSTGRKLTIALQMCTHLHRSSARPKPRTCAICRCWLFYE